MTEYFSLCIGMYIRLIAQLSANQESNKHITNTVSCVARLFHKKSIVQALNAPMHLLDMHWLSSTPIITKRDRKNMYMHEMF